MNHQVLQQTLQQLRLAGLQQTLAVRLQEAAANRLSHADFLESSCKMNWPRAPSGGSNGGRKPPTSAG